jgi:hypothetical protein
VLLDKQFEAGKDKYWLCGEEIFPATSCYQLNEFDEVEVEEGTGVVASPYGKEYCDSEERFVGPPYLFGGPPYLNDPREREKHHDHDRRDLQPYGGGFTFDKE